MQHENGLRHKGNVERSLREAYKKSERERIEEKEVKRKMEEIERKAKQSYNEKDKEENNERIVAVAAGASRESKTKESKPAAKWKPSDKLATYGSAMPVYADEKSRLDEMYRQQRELEEAERAKEGTAGAWQTIEPQTSAPSETKIQPSEGIPRASTKISSSSSYKVREKKGNYHVDDEEEGTLDSIKVKKRIRTGDEEERKRRKEEEQRAMLPQWTPVRLDTGISAKQEGIQGVPVQRINNDESDSTPVDLSKEDSGEQKDQIKKEEAEQTSTSSSSNMFKKRKAGSGSGAKRVRAVV